MSQVTGRIFIKIDGELQRSKPGASLTFGGKTREPVVGDDSVHGFKEVLAAPLIEATFSDTAQLSLKKIADITDATITFETDTGKTYIVRNAWQNGDPPKLTGDGGEVAVQFAGISCEEA